MLTAGTDSHYRTLVEEGFSQQINIEPARGDIVRDAQRRRGARRLAERHAVRHDPHSRLALVCRGYAAPGD